MADSELSENSGGRGELRIEDANKAALKFLTGDAPGVEFAKAPPDLKPVSESGLSKLQKEPVQEMKPLGQFSSLDVGKAVERGLHLVDEAKQLSSTDFKQAEPKFKAATEIVREQIMQVGGGKTLEQSFGNLNREISVGLQRATLAVSDFRDGRRDLPANGRSPEELETETKGLRAKLSGIPDGKLLTALSPQELKQVLTDVEVKILDKSELLADLTQAYFQTNAEHFQSASQQALKTGNSAEKAELVKLISAQNAEMGIYLTTAFRGALLQAGADLPVDFSNGKAEAVAYVKSASDRTTGELVGEILFPRFLFGEGESDLAAQNAMAMSIIVNKDAARDTVDLIKRQESEVVKGSMIAVVDVGATYFTAQGIGNVLARYSSSAPWWAKPIAAMGGVLVGGATDNFLHGQSISDLNGYKNSAFLSALAYAPGKLITRMPELSANGGDALCRGS